MLHITNSKRLLIWSSLVALVGLILWLLSPVLAPFVVAAIFAYALTPLVDRISSIVRGKIPRFVLVVVVEVVFLTVFLGMCLLVIPVFIKQLPLLKMQVPVLLDSFNNFLQPLFADFGIHFNLDLATLKPLVMHYLNDNFQDSLGSLLSSLKLGGSVAITVVGNAVLIPVVIFYLLLDWHKIVKKFESFVPVRFIDSYDSFISEMSQVLGEYLRGQGLIMIFLAIYYSTALTAFGLDLAFPIGIFTGLAVFVPYIGFGLGLFLATLAGLLEFSATLGISHALFMVVVVFGIGQILESFFLTPRLLGDRIGLHPLAVIISLLAFGQLFGFVGILIALPASAVLLVAIRRGKTNYLNSQIFHG